MDTRHEVVKSSERIRHGEEVYQELRKAHVGDNEDERTVEALDPGGKLRAENKPASAAGGSEHGTAEPSEEAVKHQKNQRKIKGKAGRSRITLSVR